MKLLKNKLAKPFGFWKMKTFVWRMVTIIVSKPIEREIEKIAGSNRWWKKKLGFDRQIYWK